MEKNKPIWKIESEKELNPTILEYVSGEDIELDKNLVSYDIKVNKAHAKMLGQVGLISKDESESLLAALDELEQDWKAGKFVLKKEFEDVHMNIEAYLTEKLGDTGKKIHTAKSRNDQILTVMEMFVKDKLQDLIDKIVSFQLAADEISKKYSETVMPAYTHMQPAQPISFGYWLKAFNSLLDKDIEKIVSCLKHLDVCPLGSCAVSGTVLPINTNSTAKELGFSKTFENALAEISSRGEAELEALFVLVQIMLHLDKMATDLQLWSTFEFGIVELDGSISTSSSIMPQKKNPDVLEMVHAKTSEVIGLLTQNLMVLKGLPSGYNKDTQLTKKTAMAGFEIVFSTLEVMEIVLQNIKPNEQKMKEIVEKSGCKATSEVDELVLKGVPFREAYKKIRTKHLK